MKEHYCQANDRLGILAGIGEHGFAIVPELLDSNGRDAVRQALTVHKTGIRGRNDFEGYQTERVYSLLARGQIFADMVENPTVLAVLDDMLEANYLLSAGLSIDLHPGESPQAVHFDDSFYPVPRPRPPIGMSVIWAIDDFTLENGATQLIPGSHTWGDENPDGLPAEHEIALPRNGPAYEVPVLEDLETRLVDAVMPAGSALIFSGTLWHRGGGNRSAANRLAVTLQYCAPWARQQENMMLAVPPETTRTFSTRVQALMGYSIHPPFMGHIDSMHPERLLQKS
ncbi:MAG: phytanoyl-CoA dioxygenase family protein [Rhodospirillaceae bacterium]|jgi:ectoine hydroxylase-related dioxygenase (phytanoyl-CoA dioxygenase family)|nr:phytanoyl-CoA dioxygenase family protein [Rhodospirillaceae bacterium]MBT4046579.1 phytanoyl-CoA dioxygenase family protein [Rhodospirillaceae bacterium]MBT4690859.1 phytanoyl-CoA dioxygenase family protein [Rhodospirillaceae bacterium]MBT5081560.1 phytanoyl-CoA dioxygenase family protein [Rhodospirillaceae bacterium]MBT5527002.1 phytanoyl-CoA dioxygenase family protein [Rhodospirillaceae bacterium]